MGFRHKRFPPILWIPVAFFVMIFASGFLLSYYPVQDVGSLLTAWIGSVAIVTFVANGLSVRYIIVCFAIVIACNLLAYASGYDGRSMRLAEMDSILQYAEIRRITALAGQTNLLVAFVYTFPFSLFLLRRKISYRTLSICLAICTAFMFLTASRSTLPYSFIFLVFACIFYIKSPPLKFFIGLVGTLTILFALYVILTFPISDMLANSPLANIEFFRRILETLDKENGSMDQRIELVTSFVPYFYESPLIGYGPDQFKVEVGNGLYAHNNTVELLINYGLLGTLMYYSMYLVILFNIINAPRLNGMLIAPLVFLIATDFIFITHVERPLVLLLCMLLLICSTNQRRI